MLLKGERLDAPTGLRASLAVGRIAIFLAAAIGNYVVAAVTSGVGGNEHSFRRYLIIYVPLALALAAPVCCCLAFFQRWGDRWTVGYLSTWAAIVGVGFLAVLINRLT